MPENQDNDNGFKPHWITQRDGKGGWHMKPAQCRFVHFTEDMSKTIQAISDWPVEEIAQELGMSVAKVLKYVATKMSYIQSKFRNFCPFGIAQMDNGEIILAGVIDQSSGKEKTVITISPDGGQTWSPIKRVGRNVFGRPMGLTYLGKGDVMFAIGDSLQAIVDTGNGKPIRFFSKDYGRTWRERHELPVSRAGKPINTEGNYMVDRDEVGYVTRVAAFGWMGPVPYDDLTAPAIGGLSWSDDGGRTWGKEYCPSEWLWEETYEGKTYQRGVSEGSLTRAANGWMVAALRTDMQAQHMYLHNDNLEGIGISISKDEGKTWSPVKVIFSAGKMHAHLITMPNDANVMSYIVRQDVQDGVLASYTR